ncbi:MAG TPA: DUF4142 domain-containing protein [Caulobacterales bacterium]|nr:DUF4142 domain-containing protein [Caulobacterales bacterium]
MRKTTLIAVSALALAAACGQQAQQQAEAPAATETVAPAPAPIPAAPSAEEFVQKAANSDAFEIQAAQLALTHASNADVKAFARMMRTDHTATTHELTSLAPTVNLAVPTPALDSDQQAKLDALRNANGAAFDSLYVDQQVQAHQDAVSMFENFANNSAQGPLQQWAQTTLPKLRQHLDRAQALKNAA